MSTTRNRSPLFAAATALSAAGILMVPAPAQASPMFPLAPACDKYEFAGPLTFKTDIGVSTRIPTTGQTVGPGRAEYFTPGPEARSVGNPTGGINGRTIDIRVHWVNGGRSHYTGEVGDDGFASGRATNVLTKDSQGWRSDAPLKCTAAPPVQEPLPPVEAIETVQVIGEAVDVYGIPGDDSTIKGSVPQGRTVQLVGPCKRDDWCEVKGGNVPGGQGFIWGHLEI